MDNKMIIGKYLDAKRSLSLPSHGGAYISREVVHYRIRFLYTENNITESLGAYISNHQYFPHKTNVNFVDVIDEKNINFDVEFSSFIKNFSRLIHNILKFCLKLSIRNSSLSWWYCSWLSCQSTQ